MENVIDEIPQGRLPSPSSHILELISEVAHDDVLFNSVDQTAAGPHAFTVEHDDVRDVTNSVEQTQLECENMSPFTIEHNDVQDVSHIQAPIENASSPVLVQMFVTTHNKQDQQLTVPDHNMPLIQQVQQGDQVVTDKCQKGVK